MILLKISFEILGLPCFSRPAKTIGNKVEAYRRRPAFYVSITFGNTFEWILFHYKEDWMNGNILQLVASEVSPLCIYVSCNKALDDEKLKS